MSHIGCLVACFLKCWECVSVDFMSPLMCYMAHEHWGEIHYVLWCGVSLCTHSIKYHAEQKIIKTWYMSLFVSIQSSVQVDRRQVGLGVWVLEKKEQWNPDINVVYMETEVTSDPRRAFAGQVNVGWDGSTALAPKSPETSANKLCCHLECYTESQGGSQK